MESDLENWEMAKIFGKWLRYIVHGLSNWESLDQVGNVLRIWQMAKICGKWHIYLGIGLSVWETAKIFGKWRRSVGNGSNMWWNDLIICQTS